MIKVSPVLDLKEAEKAFAAQGLTFADGCAALEATDGHSILGGCLLQMTEHGVDILSITCAEGDSSLIDWLMRSAMNYAANRGAYLAFCNLSQYEDILLSLSFEKKDSYYVGEVPEIFKGCTCCASAKKNNAE